jgi:ribosome maturation factor RimP
MNLKQEQLTEDLSTIVNRSLVDPSHFLVDVIVTGSGAGTKVRVLLDGDEGISIENCAKVSRAVSEEFEALIDGKFILEVSSPGVDYPLSSERQYRKNIGRKLKVINSDNHVYKGRLKEVDSEGIMILSLVKNEKKKKVETEMKFPFNEIKKSTVLIEF